MEAPPAIISTYLGEALTNFLEQVKDYGRMLAAVEGAIANPGDP